MGRIFHGPSRPPARAAGLAVLPLVAALAGACGGVIPEAVRRGIDPGFTFAALRENPEAARGRRVAFGGEILQVTVRSQETEIEILHRPLRGDDLPDRTAESGGRFLARWSGFLDPATYPAGRLLTIAGTVEGEARRLIGEVNYRYPVIRADYLYLWPRYEIAYPPPLYSDPWWPWYPPYYPYPPYPLRWNFWWGYHYWR